MPGCEHGIWLGLMAPAGTPRRILERLNAEVVKVLNAPDVKEAWNRLGAQPMPMTIAEFERFPREEIANWGALVRAAGMKPQ